MILCVSLCESCVILVNPAAPGNRTPLHLLLLLLLLLCNKIDTEYIISINYTTVMFDQYVQQDPSDFHNNSSSKNKGNNNNMPQIQMTMETKG